MGRSTRCATRRVLAASLLIGAVVETIDAAWTSPPAWVDHAAVFVDGIGLGRAQAVLAGLLLLVLARGVAGGRLLAHRTLLALLACATLGAALGGHHPGRAAALAGALVATCAIGGWFPVLPDLRRMRDRPTLAVAIAGVAACGFGVPLLELVALDLHRRSRPPLHGVADVLAAHTWILPLAVPTAPWLPYALSLLGAAAVVVALAVLLMPAMAPPPASAAERWEVARLVAHPHSDTLAPFALRTDRAYVFSPDRRAAIGYRVLLGVAVAGGDPVGAASARAGAIDAFVALCAREGWYPMAIGVRSDHLEPWRAHRLHAIAVGDEAILDVPGLDLATHATRGVAKAIRRTRRAGVTTELCREGDLDPTTVAELREVLDEWLRGHRYHGYSMNLDGMLDGTHPDCRLMVARDRSGRPIAFQRYAVCTGGRALSLDAMPRRRGAPNGVNERMIADLIGEARRLGVDELSLNFAGFRGFFERHPGGRLLDRTARSLAHALDPLINIESLYVFTRKFRPRWVSRSVVLGSFTGVPRAAIAALGVEFGPPPEAPSPPRWWRRRVSNPGPKPRPVGPLRA